MGLLAKSHFVSALARAMSRSSFTMSLVRKYAARSVGVALPERMEKKEDQV